MENLKSIDLEDLALMEKRVAEMEKYLGIEELDLESFQENQLETIDKKIVKVEDFIKVIDDKYEYISDLQEKCK